VECRHNQKEKKYGNEREAETHARKDSMRMVHEVWRRFRV
jgi:hypothetical protein